MSYTWGDNGGNDNAPYLILTDPNGAVSDSNGVFNATVVQGQAIKATFAGFYPGASVHIYVMGGGGLYVQADGTGSGEITFTIATDAPGNHIIDASDNYGNRADAVFSVTASTISGGWRVLASLNAALPIGTSTISGGWRVLSSLNAALPLGASTVSGGWRTLASLNGALALGSSTISGGWRVLASLYGDLPLPGATPPPKNTSNTALIVGAAALAGLALASQNKTPSQTKAKKV
jgi:hypothetical protein